MGGECVASVQWVCGEFTGMHDVEVENRAKLFSDNGKFVSNEFGKCLEAKGMVAIQCTREIIDEQSLFFCSATFYFPQKVIRAHRLCASSLSLRKQRRKAKNR